MSEKKEQKTMEEKVKKSKKLSEKEYEKKVLELAEKGLTSEKIGEDLRKQGIHPKEHGIKISKILKDNKKYVSPELRNMEKKLVAIEIHSKKNKQDKRSLRERERIFSKLRKIKKYLKTA